MLTRFWNWLARWRLGHLKSLSTALESPDPHQQVWALLILSRTPEPALFTAAISCLASRHPQVRYAATHTLAEYNDPHTIEPLRQALSREEDVYIRLWMSETLLSLGYADALTALFDAIEAVDVEGISDFDGVPETIAPAIARLGPSVLPALQEALTHRNSSVRWLAAICLTEMNSPDARSILMMALNDPDEIVRQEVEAGLARQPGG